jgi:hypothetical protein
VRILLFFDGSQATTLSMQTACQEQLKNNVQPNSTKFLISIFERLPQESGLTQHQRRPEEQQTERLLDSAMQVIKNYGFHNFCGNIVTCSSADLTPTLVEHATNWQADAIYLPSDKTRDDSQLPLIKKLRAKIRRSLVFSSKAPPLPPQPQESPAIPSIIIPFSEIKLPELLVSAQSQVILTMPAGGIKMRLQYQPSMLSSNSNTTQNQGLLAAKVAELTSSVKNEAGIWLDLVKTEQPGNT